MGRPASSSLLILEEPATRLFLHFLRNQAGFLFNKVIDFCFFFFSLDLRGGRTTFCGIGEVVSFMVDGFVDGLLIFDWMGVRELCFDEMTLDAELLVFNGDFGGVLFDEMSLDAELSVFNGDFGGVLFDGM